MSHISILILQEEWTVLEPGEWGGVLGRQKMVSLRIEGFNRGFVVLVPAFWRNFKIRGVKQVGHVFCNCGSNRCKHSTKIIFEIVVFVLWHLYRNSNVVTSITFLRWPSDGNLQVRWRFISREDNVFDRKVFGNVRSLLLKGLYYVIYGLCMGNRMWDQTLTFIE